MKRLPLLLNASVSKLLTLSQSTAEFTASSDTQPLPRVNVLAYTGGLVKLEALPLPVVFDLSTTQAASNVVMLYGHDRELPIGHFDQIKINANSIQVSGLISIDNEKSREVRSAATNGFPWQASVGVQSDNLEYVAEGSTVTVNGQTIDGPCYIARNNVLREVSILSIGADPNTIVSLNAKLGVVAMTFEEWIKSLNFDPATLTPEQVSAMQDLFNQMSGSGVSEEAKAKITANAKKFLVAFAPKNTLPANNGNNSSGNAGNGTTGVIDLNAELVRIRQAAAAEQTRIDSINRLSDQYLSPRNADGLIAAQAIQNNWTLEATELAMLRASRPTNGRVASGPNRVDGVNPYAVLEAAACQSGMMQRPALEKVFNATTLQAAHEQYRGRIGLQSLLIEAAALNGYRGSTNFKAYHRDILKAAFSTMDAVNIFSNLANKYLLEGYNSVDETWRTISAIGSVPDFKTRTGYRGVGSFTFEQIGPDGMLTHGKMSDQSYTNKAETYGRMFAVTRQDQYNDDLGALTAIPRGIGRGGAIKFNKVFWTEFLDNSGNFWHSNNSNVSTGVLGIAGLNAANGVFVLLKDPNGDYIMGTPKYLLVPPVLMPTGMSLYRDTLIVSGNTTAATNGNPWVGKFEPVTSPYMQDSTITGNSSAAYYLLADPNDVPTIESVFLDGQQTPTVESADVDFSQLGIQFRGFWDFGVKKQDYRGSVRSTGA